MKTLQQYYTQAADRPLAFSEEKLRALLSVADGVPAPPPANVQIPSFGPRALRVLGVGLAIAAIATIAFQPALVVESSKNSTSVANAPSQTSSRVQAKSSDAAPLNDTPNAAIAEATPTTDGLIDSSPDSESRRALPVAPLAVAGTMLNDAVTLNADEAVKLGIRPLEAGTIAFGYLLTSDQPDEAKMRSQGFGDSLLVQTISRNGTGHRFMSRADFPLSVVTKKNSSIQHSWQVITDESGRLLDERVSVQDGNQLRYIETLFNRGAESSVARSIASVRGLDEIGQNLRLNTLLPIRVNVDNASNGVFWCRPDPTLLAALPSRTVAQLRSELEKAAAIVVAPRDTLALVRRGWALTVLATIDSIVPGSLNVESDIDVAPQGMTGAEIFAGTRNRAGAITRFQPAKNPASKSTTLKLELTQPRRVTVTLHDVNGRRIKMLATTRAIDEGNAEIVASLDGIEKGMYLIAISTDRKEQVVQRLVVE